MAQQKKDFKEIVPDVETNAALPDIVKKNWSSINDKGQHLAQYLGIRFGYIDPTGSAVAMMRGAQDMEKMRTPELRQCTDKCMATALKVPQEQFTSCMRACDPETLPRIWSCNNLSWLPF
ncbi:hypothetical protein AWB71_05275 [Caballeronia peredens]|nr:hypothetical protein AWB71_05275 [Caballeronia peredens]